MKTIAQSLTLGLAVLAASTTTPRAADWVGSGGVIKDFGNIKDYRNAAVPVPAPTPSNTPTADWYVRGDFGYNLATNVDVKATGNITARGEDDLNGFAFGSVGVGRYITPSIRGELSFDFRPHKTVTQGTQYYKTKLSVVGPTVTDPVTGLSVQTYDTKSFDVAQSDSSYTTDTTAFLSLYYDYKNSSRFTPYVGAGIGLDAKRYKRSVTNDAVCTGTTNPLVAYPAGFCNAPTTYSSGANRSTTELGFAAAFMVGTGYQVAQGVSLDAGYRLVWAGAAVSLGSTTINGDSTISISDRFDHELRTGIRIDLN